jgi:hypothetical protein
MKRNSLNHILGKKYDGMMGRCYRQTETNYKNYGAKGIRVCSVWIKDINTYKEWITTEISKITTLEEFCKKPSAWQVDRINTSGHYSPENCRIVSPQKNIRNTSSRCKKEIISAEGELIII